MTGMDDMFWEFLSLPPSRPRQRKLAVIVAAELAEGIVVQGLRPGDPLPNEAEMLAQLDVSRGTLREALRVLETQGVIIMRTGRGGGPVVARPSPGALVETLTVNFRALQVSFEEILYTRDTVEPALARQAALNRSDEDLVRLRDAHRTMVEADPTTADVLRLNRQFHTAVAIASRNRPLAIMWSAISTVADGQGVGTRYDERLWSVGNAAHAKILRAIEEGDADSAEKAMATDVHAFHAEMESSFPDLLSAPVNAHQSAPTSD